MSNETPTPTTATPAAPATPATEAKTAPAVHPLDAILPQLNVQVDDAKWNMAKRLFDHDKPTDVSKFVDEVLDAFGAATPTYTGKYSKQSVATGTSNTGAAGGDARSQIPNDIMAINGDVWSQLSPAEKLERYQAEKRAKGGDYNPFAASRAAKAKGGR